MWKKTKVADQTATGQTVDDSEEAHPDDKGIKKKSKVPGVMITQFMEELPEGKTTPDFTRKPIGLTIQEGKFAFFKAIVVGDPKPTVTWTRTNGELLFHPNVCMQKYDEASRENTLEFPKVSPEDADTYKCFATNEYGRAVCTVVLNVIEVGFSKAKELQKTAVEDAAELRKKLKKRNPDGTRDQKPMETEERVWEILLSADKKDYERICTEYGITDFRGMLKRLNEMKKEREEEIAQFVTQIRKLKPVEVKDDNCATIELDMDLTDPTSKIFLYKDGVMVAFSKDEAEDHKHQLKRVGKKYVFTIKKLGKDDAGLYSVDVEGVNVFSTEFKVPEVDFALKIQEVKAEEREDALFQCVLTTPMNEIKWYGKNALLSNGEKYEITVSEDKLIHKLIVRDCMPLDGGIYAAVVGIKSCNAWLIVEADKGGDKKSKKARKTTIAGGTNEEELMRIAKEQQEKYQKDMEEAIKAQAEKEASEAAARLEAKKVEAEARAAAKAAAKAKRAAAGKDGAARKSRKKGDDAAPGEGSAADGAGGVGGVGGARPGAEGAGMTGGAGGVGGIGGVGGVGGISGVEGVGGVGGAGGVGGVGGVEGASGAGGVGGVVGVGGAGAKGGVGGVGGAGGAGGVGVGGVGGVGVGGTGGVGGAGEVGGVGVGGVGGVGVGGAGGVGVGGTGGVGGAGGVGGVGVGGVDGVGGVEDFESDFDEYDYDSFEDSDEDIEGGGTGEGAGGRQGGKGGDKGEGAEGEEGGEGGEGGGKAGKRKKRVRAGPLIPETVVGDINNEETTSQQGEKSREKGKRPKKENVEMKEPFVDPGVHFHAGLSDCKAVVGEAAELECKVSSEDCVGTWYKDGVEIESSEDLNITKDGCFHRLKIKKVTEEYAGKYKFEADGRKTESEIVVEDPPRFDAEELEAFSTPVTVKKGHKASFKMGYVGREPIKAQWYLDGEELTEESNIKIEHSEGGTRLLLLKLQRKDSGEIKIKLKNEFGTTEVCSQLIVLDKPTPPLGPLEIVEAGSSLIDFKWRAPKDSGGCKIQNYILERQQVGRNTWKKVGPIGPDAHFKDTDVDHGRRYCYRIRVETEMGISELMETEDIQAGTKAYPGSPSAPKVVSAFKDCINLSWVPPANTGGTNILGFNLEKRKKGSNLWGPVNPPDDMIKGKGFAVKDVVEGIEYEFRVSAINNSGAGEFSAPSEFVFARDPKKPPGKVTDLKVTDSTCTTLSLSWTKPKDIAGVEDEAKGYFVEIRPAESTEWDRCNTNLITMNSYTVKGMKSMAMYWVRVIAANDGGQGEPQELDNYILAMPPPVRPRFTDSKIKSFMVVRAGNSARFNINFEASPWPDVIWLKDGMPVSKKVTISNAEGTSQLLIPSAERSDTGIYTIIVKNIVGQETISIEIRVTDEPKPPGPVEMDENVPGTVTISWTPSPDEKRDDRLHYMVTKRDSSKRTWHTVADRIFNNKFTACNIMPGREYQFRVYAKNDMGSSAPSESAKWLIVAKKEKFTVKMPESKVCDLRCPPKFIVPLKQHTAPQGYECYMSCAIKGDPTPHVTWLRNNISLNTNTNYFISNTCGVCSLLILRVGSKDTGEYKVVAENTLGTAECSTKLSVRE